MFDAAQIATTIAVVSCAGVFRGFAGFGAGLFMVPLLTLVFPPAIVVPTVLLTNLGGDVRLVPEVWREANKRRVAWLVAGAFVGMPLGIYGLATLDGELVRTSMNIVILLTVAMLVGGFRFEHRERTGVLLPTGVVSGVLTGVGGIGGPPIVLMLLSGSHQASDTRATLICFFATSAVAALIMMLVGGVLTLESAALAGIGIIPYTLAIHTGSKLFHRGSGKNYRTIALLFLGCLALTGLLWPV